MPLTATEDILGAALFSMVQKELAATGKPPDPSSLAHLKAFCNGIAKGLVPHLITNTEVAPGIPTPGGPTSAPGKLQ